jgi:hypothetical protein
MLNTQCTMFNVEYSMFNHLTLQKQSYNYINPLR